MTAGLSRAGFDIDLRDGKAREDSLARVLRGRVELKFDYLSSKTGNVFIEFEQAGPPTNEPRPSGLAASDAEWWAFGLADGLYVLISRERLLRLARRAYREGRVRKGGDFDLYKGVLIPVSWLTAEPRDE